MNPPAPILPTEAAAPSMSALARQPRALKALGLIGLLWLLFCLLIVLAGFADVARMGRREAMAGAIVDGLVGFPPLTLYHWWLWLHAETHPQGWSQPGPLLKTFAVSMAVYLICWVPYTHLVMLLQQGQPLSQLWSAIQKQRSVYLIYDAMLACCAFLVQFGYTALRLAQRREQAWRQEQTANLQLRLTLLQGQLEPHFLFNALNGISALVRGGDRSQALSALSRVSELLRYALRASRHEWLSLADELQFIRDYVELQTLRFGAGLSLRWRIDETIDWQDIACPPLLLQPLVENAIRHGLEAGDGVGDIDLQLRLEQGMVRLRLDNRLPTEPGLGIKGHGLGVPSTRERLTMLFGEQASLQTQIEQGRFIVSLSFPARGLDETLDRADR
ncbi:histidine kinase [Paucibacter sp. APW11]|uniref:Histidine kinase n=1 Tax=Roseateles aquae TaxID=3077235 RepID=A0ABU3PDV6_9BURK|nr:histidine kinase [Paucibacter sp. APW11]MDT9000749.1 histidine kinase [Paucibacter sp. APW11]